MILSRAYHEPRTVYCSNQIVRGVQLKLVHPKQTKTSQRDNRPLQQLLVQMLSEKLALVCSCNVLRKMCARAS